MDCGPTCLRMIAKHYGKVYSVESLQKRSYFGREGVSLLGLSDAAEAIGFRTLRAKIPFEKLLTEAPLPFIAHWRRRHFIVIYGFRKNRVYAADPAHGLIEFSREEFLQGWVKESTADNPEAGVVLLLEPTPAFTQGEDELSADRTKLSFFLAYLVPYRRYIIQLFLGMMAGSLLQLILPFLTQSLVDTGINTRNLSFVNLILIAQIVLIGSRMMIDLIRNWIILHMGTRITVSILSDFLIKVMKLPIAFFDSKTTGDLLQRINDHKRIDDFLSSSVLNVVFSTVNIFLFGLILAYYNITIFSVFLGGSVLYMLWVLLFLKKRRELDYKLFDQLSDNQSNLIELITGMQEIKLQNSERQKRWDWERVQAKLYKINIRSLAISQAQTVGSTFINEGKNILLSYIAAKAVINGQITFGMMLAIQYIIGQLNAPINSLIGFIQIAQDAKISLERLGQIHNKDNEESAGLRATTIPINGALRLQNISFQYDGPHSPQVLKDVSINIEAGKVTAIVGASGSGKTTLVKMLLKFYEPVQGEIILGNTPFQHVSHHQWRERCGAVMQDGYIFADSIARNIAVSEEEIDTEKLRYAVEVANIREFIEALPRNYDTKIGSSGIGLSQGQRQRILIARAVFKNPEYLFFDEATNALDANNERIITDNLKQFYAGRTVVIVAHRLSTVVNADQILVMDKGNVIEQGTHQDLVRQQGMYFRLIKNQLELGS
jgi:ATP-binding cassette subfamily B protein